MRPDPAINAVADNIRRVRQAAGISQVELSRRSGLDLRAVQRIEAAQRDPTVRSLARLARGLNVDPRELWRDVS